MPKSKGVRLWWRKESRKADGSLRSKAGWFIRDGNKLVGVGGTLDRAEAERRLSYYIAEKYQPARSRDQDPAEAKVADVVNIYLTDVAPKHSRPHETAARLMFIIDGLGELLLTEISGRVCRDYAAQRSTPQAARRELEDLRSALNHYQREGYCLAVPKIVLPEKAPARERWLTRSEAAALLWAAWRMKQTWKGQESDRRTGRHLARFILVALYTGTRSAAVCGAALRHDPDHDGGFVDLDRGVFYRRAPGSRETKKRRPPVVLPSRLLAHVRRWQRLGIAKDHVVEWNGRPVKSIRKAFASARTIAKLDDSVTPHILRHSGPTWAMQNGANLWKTADYFGMTVETLERTYGHHRPDHHRDIHDAITRTPQLPHRSNGNKAEHRPSNVTPIAEKRRVS